MKQKLCKQCKNSFEPMRPLQMVCSALCASNYQRKQTEKRLNKEKIQRNKVDKESILTTSDWLGLAQKVFNKYVRLRDENLPCISCGTNKAKWDAGHFHSQGGHSFLRFNLLNVNKQCYTCNREKHSNPHNYREGLIKKIGAANVEWLDLNRKNPIKFSTEDAKNIIKEYRAKIKELKSA